MSVVADKKYLMLVYKTPLNDTHVFYLEIYLLLVMFFHSVVLPWIYLICSSVYPQVICHTPITSFELVGYSF